ncbi:MAG: hypothetical protein EBU51_00310 [Synechococcaceae bacterium WB6_3A_227]|nr:hypothetical protein [Synechococcaceae bacterium WB6_3A_227]
MPWAFPQAKGKMACSWQLAGEINAPSSLALDGGETGRGQPTAPEAISKTTKPWQSISALRSGRQNGDPQL